MKNVTETWVRCDKSRRVDVSGNMNVVDRSAFRYARDEILVGRDVFDVGEM